MEDLAVNHSGSLGENFLKFEETSLGQSELDPVSRVTGIPGWYWILGIKCSDTTGVVLLK